MTVQDVLNIITARITYIPQSILLKSSDESGATYKWLEGIVAWELCAGTSLRCELFVATDYADKDKEVAERTVIVYTEVFPAK